jgi:hypothetical protein
MNKLLILILATSVATAQAADNSYEDIQARSIEAYNVMKQQAAANRAATTKPVQPSLGHMISAASLAYSVNRAQGYNNPYAAGSALGALSSHLPYYSGATLSSIINGR